MNFDSVFFALSGFLYEEFFALGLNTGLNFKLPQNSGASSEVSSTIRLVVALTFASLLPSLLISMTSFVRIIIVFSMLRQAIGLQDTPPNSVLISLALFLTVFSMAPTMNEVNQNSLQPFLNGKATVQQSLDAFAKPTKEFMLRQTRDSELALMVELAKLPPLAKREDIGMLQLIPAFMLSELKIAFQIGFVIFLPFLLIDLVVAVSLMSLGMMMMPPITISLPLKVLLFILMDGWALVVRAIFGTLG